MFELVQITENCYYIQSPAKIGLVKLNGQDVCLIDSGNDKDAGRKIRQHLDANEHLTVTEVPLDTAVAMAMDGTINANSTAHLILKAERLLQGK